jgi:ribosomal protein S27AE
MTRNEPAATRPTSGHPRCYRGASAVRNLETIAVIKDSAAPRCGAFLPLHTGRKECGEQCQNADRVTETFLTEDARAATHRDKCQLFDRLCREAINHDPVSRAISMR